MRAELEASKSELAAFRLRLADMENGCSKSKAKEDAYRTPTAMDEDRAVHRLMERMQAMEAEMASSLTLPLTCPPNQTPRLYRSPSGC